MLYDTYLSTGNCIAIIFRFLSIGYCTKVYIHIYIHIFLTNSDNGRILARSLIDLYLTNVTWMWLIRCLGPGVEIVDEGYVLDVIYSTVFFVHLLAGMVMNVTIQCRKVN